MMTASPGVAGGVSSMGLERGGLHRDGRRQRLGDLVALVGEGLQGGFIEGGVEYLVEWVSEAASGVNGGRVCRCRRAHPGRRPLRPFQGNVSLVGDISVLLERLYQVLQRRVDL